MHTFESEPVDNEPIVPIFWTGGWDSTFRLLDLIVHHRCTVQPIYVIDTERLSYKHELQTMELIKSELVKQHPDRARLLKETIFLNREDVLLHNNEQEHLATLRTVFTVGSQFAWLAAVSNAVGLDNIELSHSEDDNKFIVGFARSHSTKVTLPCGASTHIMGNWEPTDAFEEGMQLFRGFAFPLIYTDTAEMERLANQHHFGEILEKSWTCQRPFRNQPCGVCNYCDRAIKGGKTAHFSKSALWRNKYRTIVNPILVFWNNPHDGVSRIADRILGRNVIGRA